MSALALERVGVRYRGVPAVSEVSLTLEAGQILAVVGPNGAGKTSLLHAAMGVVPSDGVVRFDGRDLARDGVEARVTGGLVLVPERRELFSTMSVADNLLLGGWRHRRRGSDALRRARDEQYARFPRLAERAAQRAGTLSGGERQMLAMGRALMAQPVVLMLDEPSLGLAPLIVRELFAIIQQLARAGVAVLLVEQNARAALAIADQALVLEAGRVVLSGASDAVAADPRVIASYLGSPAATAAGGASASAASDNRKLNPG